MVRSTEIRLMRAQETVNTRRQTRINSARAGADGVITSHPLSLSLCLFATNMIRGKFIEQSICINALVSNARVCAVCPATPIPNIFRVNLMRHKKPAPKLFMLCVYETNST